MHVLPQSRKAEYTVRLVESKVIEIEGHPPLVVPRGTAVKIVPYHIYIEDGDTITTPLAFELPEKGEVTGYFLSELRGGERFLAILSYPQFLHPLLVPEDHMPEVCA
jgi:hypothetical protein